MVSPMKAFLPITTCSAVRSQCRRSRAIPFVTRKTWKQKMKLIVHVSATTFAPRLQTRKRDDSSCVESQCWTPLRGRARCTSLGSAWIDHQLVLEGAQRGPNYQLGLGVEALMSLE